jgi:hypothetical protein
VNVALAICLVLVALLCVPFSLQVSLGKGWRFEASPRWGPFRLLSDAPSPPPRAVVRKPPKRDQPRGRRSRGFRKLRALLLSPDFLPSLGRLGRRLVAHARPRHLRLRLKLGLGDPADTGRVWGALTPLFLSLLRLEADELRFEPDFIHRSFDVEGRAVVRVVPGVVLSLLVGYLLTPAPWRALVRYARA